ncbi:MAG: cysteine desulfurase [Flavobacteriales bacterium]|nr:cysteine desulfurase [Flavobacteriales bacterium]
MTKVFNVAKVREDFPILKREVNGKTLVYLDNGATAQKPQTVIDALTKYYTHENSNIHRGVHTLSQEATSAYELTREKIQDFINAPEKESVIFTKGTTDGINLLAFSLGRDFVQEGDEIIISAMEHHSNIVPWQMLCEQKKAVLKVAPINQRGEIILEEYKKLLNPKTKLVSIVHISNTLGTINPIQEMIAMAHEVGAKFIVDAAQSAPHLKIDVQALDCDFMVFSMHKVFGPTGVGFLYGKKELLEVIPPYQGGGDMIKTVTFEKTTYNELPHKFEAGTPNIAAGIATSAAIDYMNQLDWNAVHLHEKELLDYATAQLKLIDGLRIIGEAKEKASVISFVIDGVHPYDVGVIIDKMGIAVRTGHHCTQPLMDWFKIPGTIRASFAFYNTKEEVDLLVVALKRALQMLR